MFSDIWANVKKQEPLVHCITNYVTANDVANMILALGASPMMADDPREAAEITAASQGLLINLGTLNQQSIEAMFLAGKKANELGHPVILDPVGVGASNLRKETAQKLLQEINFTAIRGNFSEIKALADGKAEGKGVDVASQDQITAENLAAQVSLIKQIAQQLQTVICVSGVIDIVTDGEAAYCLFGGDPLMSRVTGSGCQLTGMIAAILAANSDQILASVVAASAAMNLCGEIGVERMQKGDGNASLRNYLIDAAFNLTGKELEQKTKYEIY